MSSIVCKTWGVAHYSIAMFDHTQGVSLLVNRVPISQQSRFVTLVHLRSNQIDGFPSGIRVWANMGHLCSLLCLFGKLFHKVSGTNGWRQIFRITEIECNYRLPTRRHSLEFLWFCTISCYTTGQWLSVANSPMSGIDLQLQRFLQ